MIDLNKISTLPPENLDKDLILDEIRKLQGKLKVIQTKMIQKPDFAILVILQGMDASGKDGVVRTSFTGLNPLNINVHGFKKPTDLEMKHDFLWRVHQEVPALGQITIFNRSQYEDVLIQKVHNWVSEEVIEQRYSQINDFERLLTQNNVKILKCYLHVSREKQHERLMERKTNPEEKYKYNENDLVEAEYWDQYRNAYEMAINKCNEVPWQIIPSDKNWYKSYDVLKKLLELLKS